MFRRKDKSTESFIGYMQDVFKEASLQVEDLSLYVIGQYDFEGEEQIQAIAETLSLGDYMSCHGYHNSSLMTDVVILYLAIGPEGCKILIVYDPFELFSDASLLSVVEVSDCGKALQAAVKKSL